MGVRQADLQRGQIVNETFNAWIKAFQKRGQAVHQTTSRQSTSVREPGVHHNPRSKFGMSS